MQDTEIARIRGLSDEGWTALRLGDRVTAELSFSRALGLIEDVADGKARRREYAGIGVRLARSPFAYLAIQAAKEALRLDRESDGKVGHWIGDMLTYGSALAHMNQLAEAADVFQQLLDVCVQQGRYADAASASTNLAACMIQLGDLEKARRQLEQSLEYLRKQKFPETELFTRIQLLDVYHYLKQDPTTILTLARETLERFSDQLPGDFRSRIEKRIRAAEARRRRSAKKAP